MISFVVIFTIKTSRIKTIFNYKLYLINILFENYQFVNFFVILQWIYVFVKKIILIITSLPIPLGRLSLVWMLNFNFNIQGVTWLLAYFSYNFFFLCSSIFQHTFLQSYILPEGFSICFWSHLQVSAFFTLVILAFPWSLSSLLQMLSPIILYRCFILYFLTAWILQNNRQVALKIFNMLHRKKETAKNAHHKNVTDQYFQYLNTTMQRTT